MMGFDTHPVLMIGVFFVLIVGASFGLAALHPDNPTAGACEAELGDGWENAGMVDVPNTDHYHVQCVRDTGLLSNEERWITVPRPYTTIG